MYNILFNSFSNDYTATTNDSENTANNPANAKKDDEEATT